MHVCIGMFLYKSIFEVTLDVPNQFIYTHMHKCVCMCVLINVRVHFVFKCKLSKYLSVACNSDKGHNNDYKIRNFRHTAKLWYPTIETVCNTMPRL